MADSARARFRRRESAPQNPRGGAAKQSPFFSVLQKSFRRNTARLRGEETAGEGVSSDDDHLGNAERNSSECVGFSDQANLCMHRRLVKVHPDGDETLSADKDYPIGTERVHQGDIGLLWVKMRNARKA